MEQGVAKFVGHPGRVGQATSQSVARALGMSETSFADQFPIRTSNGRFSRAGALGRYFRAVRDKVMAQTGLTEDQRRKVELFDAVVRERFPEPTEAVHRELLADIARYRSTQARAAAGRALKNLQVMPPGRDQFRACAQLLVVFRDHVPLDGTPGHGLRLELAIIKLLTGALATRGTGIARGFWNHQALPQIQISDPVLAEAVLSAEAKVRHGVPVQDALTLPASFEGATRGRRRSAQLAVADAVVRGLLERGLVDAVSDHVERDLACSVVSLNHPRVVQQS